MRQKLARSLFKRSVPEACDGVQSGTVSLYGTPLSHLTEPAARSIGVVFQDPDQQFCMLTVEDEIAFGLENLQYTKEDMDAIINDVLEKLEITHLKTRTIASLSGGSKQKVALACIIAMEPELIILDEPTAQLDPYSARELVRLIKDLQAKKASAFSLSNISLIIGRRGWTGRLSLTKWVRR